MRKYVYSTKFSKNIEKAKRQKQNIEAVKNVIEILISGGELPEKNLDHPLKGNWKGYRECHIQNDLLLIYKLDKDDNIDQERVKRYNDY